MHYALKTIYIDMYVRFWHEPKCTISPWLQRRVNCVSIIVISSSPGRHQREEQLLMGCHQQRFCSEQQCGVSGVTSSDSAQNNSGACPVSPAAILLRMPAPVLLKMPTSASVAKLCQEKQAGKIKIRQHRIASGCHIISWQWVDGKHCQYLRGYVIQ